MSNYYLDTNVLIGHCFLQNRWQDHTDRLFSTNNTLHTSEIVVYEYCVKDSPGRPESETTIDWSSTDGVFGTIQRKIRKGKRYTELELRKLDHDEVTPEKVAELVIEKFDIQDEVKEKVTRHFVNRLPYDCDRKDARKAVDKLVHTITSTAKDRKSELAERVQFHRRAQNHRSVEDQLRRLIYHDDESYGPDAAVLTDAFDLKQRGIVERVVTGDKGDIYLNLNEIDAITGLTILYLKDEFANQEGQS
ncbi:hypothetical protein [Haloarchaeobius amylolyticus]|uniref:hypothetical protein n=1 Tax=Haloarchaeobius amylolyticus TaxID=1198296 RepID=UPI00226DD47F|nr:hypothetical protein [Haloarchaeobius amylolyticus]